MKRSFPKRPAASALAAACLAVLLPAVALAEGSDAPSGVLVPGSPAAAAPATVQPDAPALALRAELNTRLAALFAAEQGQVAALRERLAGTRDHAEALALQAAIAGAKEQAEGDCLRIQLDIARRAGWTEAVAALEADLVAMEDLAAMASTAAAEAPAMPAAGEQP